MDGNLEARGHEAESPLSISQLNWYVKNLLEQAMPSLWAEGEISDLSRPASGHIYFTLKDDRSQVRAVIWRSTAQRMKFKLRDGMSIVCRGAVEVYPPRGSYQLIVSNVVPQGVGPLQLALEQLRNKLSAEGLFAAEAKQPLPKFPRRIAFVTSPSGAAIHDFLQASADLWNDFELLVVPARVQGDQAKDEISRGIEAASRIPDIDIIVVGRGGGSLEDLWAFNEERVVRTLAACRVPTVSAVGHEIDVTLSDLAADARALTPTHAAQILFPNKLELGQRLDAIKQRLTRNVWSRYTVMAKQLEALSTRSILSRPHDVHLLRRQQIDELEARGARAIKDRVESGREKLASLARATEALSPLGVLTRGYSLTAAEESNKTLRSVDQTQEGEHIVTRLPDGKILSQVIKTERIQ